MLKEFVLASFIESKQRNETLWRAIILFERNVASYKFALGKSPLGASKCREFDGVWACASLLHILKDHMASCFSKLVDALKVGGVLYSSFKYGNKERSTRIDSLITMMKSLSMSFYVPY